MCSLGGLAPAFSALATALTSAKTELGQQTEDRERNIGRTCTLNILGLIKCMAPNLDLSLLLELEPAGEEVQKAMEECYSIAERIVEGCLSTRETASSSEDNSSSSDKEEE